MNAKEVEKTIRKYTVCKFIFLTLFCLMFTFFLGSIILYWNEPFDLYMFIPELIMIFLGWLFPINNKLCKTTSTEDYYGIIHYISNMPSDIGKYMYFDGLVMIKNTINDIASDHLYNQKQYVIDSVLYLQELFCDMDESDKRSIIPEKLMNRNYLKKVCEELIRKLDEQSFIPNKLEKIKSDTDFTITHKCRTKQTNLKLKSGIAMTAILAIKIIVTIDYTKYCQINENWSSRLFYNSGIDIIALFLLGYEVVVNLNKENGFYRK